MKNIWIAALATAIVAWSVSFSASAETIRIATVNNGDMIRMQKLSAAFEQANPGIELDWVVMEENVLRQRVTTDIATKGGQFDVLTIGTYEVPIWAERGWLAPLANLASSTLEVELTEFLDRRGAHPGLWS